MMEGSGRDLELDIDGMNEEELRAVLEAMQDAAGTIEGQLMAAKAKRVTTGEFADPVWFAKATSAMKIKRRMAAKIERRLKALRVGAYEERDRYAECFITAARGMLREDVFVAIDEMARSIAQAPRDAGGEGKEVGNER